LRTQLSYLWQDPEYSRQFKTAVSLHGHTSHSKESLFYIVKRAEAFLPYRLFLKTQEWRARNSSGIVLKFEEGYWTPPLPPLEAYRVETKQIEDKLGVDSMVSLSDHDNIEAPMLLRVVPETRRIPVSMEWSVPFKETEFHLGIHNLPTAEAEAYVQRMHAYTASPEDGKLKELLAELVSIPQVLIVLNHPLWDLPAIGQARHNQLAAEFLCLASSYLHAFELGGLRPWKENDAVVDLANAFSKPVISGGDRHGCEPSAILNLTNASSFSEFTQEIRQGHSVVLFMPQYAESTYLRMAQTLVDAIAFYPDHPKGLRRWDDRVFHPDWWGEHKPVSSLWRQPPEFIPPVFACLRLAHSGAIRRAFRWAAGKELATRFGIGAGQEAVL
jgi:hypothetical protein